MIVLSALAIYGLSVGCTLLAAAFVRFLHEASEAEGPVVSDQVLMPFTPSMVILGFSTVLWIAVAQEFPGWLMLPLMGLGIYSGIKWLKEMKPAQ